MKLSYLAVKNFVVGAIVVGVLVVGAAPVQAALSLTFSDGNPLHEQVVTDSGSPGIIIFNGTVGDWLIIPAVGVFNDSQGIPTMDLDYGVIGAAGNSSVLTITLTETGIKPQGSIGDMLLALGGTGGSSTMTQIGIINGSIAGVQGPFSSSGFYGSDGTFTISPMGGDEFSISEQLVFTGTGHNGGDAAINFLDVPEPGTAIAGAFAGTCGICVIAARVLKIRRRPKY